MVFTAVDWQVKSNRFPELRSRFPDVVCLVIAKSTADAYARSQITVPVRRPDVERRTGVTGGALKASGQVRISGMTGEVFYTMYYAGYVHEGTVHVAARPWLRNAFYAIIPSMEMAFSQLEGLL